MKQLIKNTSPSFGRHLSNFYPLRSGATFLVMENLQEEIWKTIDGYSNYMVSNYGRIKSLPNKRYSITKILNGHISKIGYKRISIVGDNGKPNIKYAHRLVASSFIPNPENKPQVNHINGIKTDNRIENLEWVTGMENIIHSIKNGLSPSSIKNCKHYSKPVLQYDLDMNFIAEYPSLKEAERVTGIQSSYIGKVCIGAYYMKRKRKNGFCYKIVRPKQANGFIWKFKNLKDAKPRI